MIYRSKWIVFVDIIHFSQWHKVKFLFIENSIWTLIQIRLHCAYQNEITLLSILRFNYTFDRED